MMKNDEEWMKNDEGWTMMISNCWLVLGTDRLTDICECRVAFVTENTYEFGCLHNCERLLIINQLV